jgi:hypothetical protein
MGGASFVFATTFLLAAHSPIVVRFLIGKELVQSSRRVRVMRQPQLA